MRILQNQLHFVQFLFFQETYAQITVALPTQATDFCSLEQLLGPFTYCADVDLSALGSTLLDSLYKLLFRLNVVVDLIAANSSMGFLLCQYEISNGVRGTFVDDQ